LVGHVAVHGRAHLHEAIEGVVLILERPVVDEVAGLVVADGDVGLVAEEATVADPAFAPQEWRDRPLFEKDSNPSPPLRIIRDCRTRFC
jgi:hypothetical protein